MKITSRRTGFTAVELITVIVAISTLFSTLFPSLTNSLSARKGRETQCVNNQRQLAISFMMYAQEHEEQLPGANWLESTNIRGGIKFGEHQILICPEEKGLKATADDNSPVSYGYNGLLIEADGKGMGIGSLGYPTGIALLADTTPAGTIKLPGVVGGSMGRTGNAVEVAYRHSGNTIVSFCDGHVELVKPSNVRSIDSEINMAFITAPALGHLWYQGSGLTIAAIFEKMTVPCQMSGEYCTQPILSAVANVLNSKLGEKDEAWTSVRTFTGEKSATDGICGTGSNVPPAGAVAIARDAMVVIRSKFSSKVPTNLTSEQVKAYYANLTANTYNYDNKSGSREFFYSKIGLPYDGNDVAATIATNDYDMVQKVANDPDGIGYCSAAFADPNLVDIITVDGISFPNPDPKASAADKYLWPTQAPTTAYPFMRTLYASAPAMPKEGDTEFMQKLPEVLKAVQTGPLFKLSYFLP